MISLFQNSKLTKILDSVRIVNVFNAYYPSAVAG